MAPSEGKSISEFLKGFRSDATKESYYKKSRYFLEWLGIPADEFLESKKNQAWTEKQIIGYVEVRRNELLAASQAQYNAITRLMADNRRIAIRYPGDSFQAVYDSVPD
jgi:hypothetical protein